MFIYSASYDPGNASLFNMDYANGRQIMWLGISAVFIFAILLIDGKAFSAFAYVVYGGILLLLLMVLLFGVEINGSKSWFTLGSFRFQPAELAKMGTCLALAKFVSGNNIKLSSGLDQFKALTIMLVPALFILKQGDMGSALVFFALIFVLFREGLSPWYLIIGFSLIFLSVFALVFDKFFLICLYAIPIILYLFYNRKFTVPGFYTFLLGAVLFTTLIMFNRFLPDTFSFPKMIVPLAIFMPILLIGLILKITTNENKGIVFGTFIIVCLFTFSVSFAFNNVLKEHQRDRVNVMLGLDQDPYGAGYNLFQSKIAIGSGGLWGKGYLDGTQTKYDFVPEQNTDFIFSTIGEEFGFMGSVVIILLFCGLLWRIIFVADRQRSQFARIYGYGVASIFLFHFFINIGMTIGIAPVIGIPLPFISYGGSSLLSFSILLFILVRLDTQRLEVL